MLAPAPAGGHTQAHRGLQQVHAPIYRAAWKGCQCMPSAGTGSIHVLSQTNPPTACDPIWHRAGQVPLSHPHIRACWETEELMCASQPGVCSSPELISKPV